MSIGDGGVVSGGRKPKSRVIFSVLIVAPVVLLLASWIVQSMLPNRFYRYTPVVVSGVADVFYNRGETRLVVVSDEGVRTPLYCEAFSRWNRCLHARGMGIKFGAGDSISAVILKPKYQILANNVVIGLKSNEQIIMSISDRAAEIDVSCKSIHRPLSLSGWGDLGELDQCL